MITLTVNRRTIRARKGATILEAARANGVYIPALCYLPQASASGSCGLCLVKTDRSSGFVRACQTKAIDGLIVETDSQELREIRGEVIKMLCVNHPLQCGVCDKSGECELQNKALEFGLREQRFFAREPKRTVEEWAELSYDPALCIMCERCVRTCNEVVGLNALSIAAGGYRSKVVFDEDRCRDCGECAAVCPVGAIVTKDFKYRANTWELTKTPSTCVMCPCGCDLFYETKRDRLMRVTNDVEKNALCALGRRAVFELNGAPSIKALRGIVEIDANSSNEEAYLLTLLSEKLGFTIANDDVRAFQSFLRTYGAACGEPLYSADMDTVRTSGTILIVSSSLMTQAPMLYSAIYRAMQNGAEAITISPIDRADWVSTQRIRCEAGAEEGVLALILSLFADRAGVHKWTDTLDYGNIYAESNVSEEEIEMLKDKITLKTTLIVGSEIYSHARAEAIAAIVGFLRKAGMETLMIPPSANALGIALLCDLVPAGDAAVKLPYIPAIYQEGTITTLNKEVKPLHAALTYSGETLGLIAKKLGEKIRWTVDCTEKLPPQRGFKPIAFDRIEAYALKTRRCATSLHSPEQVSEIGEFNGTVVHFVNRGHKKEGFLRGSAQFATLGGISDGDLVTVRTKKNTFNRRFIVDKNLKGTIADLEVFDLPEYAQNGYGFESVKLSKAGD
ncbi:MAG: (2Fe-2S)-binding protein [Helicobacteraceae bacterium]|jgi:NADH-quinone oxidoreductase subunit G|nr:(2Fe-2S)-binding protein [Helicobacteraceae bacterium]